MRKIYPSNFKRYRLIYLGINLFLGLIASATIYSQTVITNPASPWTVPAGVSSVKVEVWGGGGGGGGAFGGAGGGGGGGSYKTATLTVTPGDNYTVTIGTGGAGGTVVSGTGINGSVGGTTTFTGPGGTVTTLGGRGGNTGNGGNGSPGAAGGLGGTYNGGSGASSLGNGAGGGGGAGNNGVGGNGSNIAAGVGGAGNPNSAPYIGGNGGSPQTNQGAGNNGNGPGGGGGGAKDNSFSTVSDGGAGAQGQVVLTYTINLTPTITGFSPGSGCANTTPVTITGTNFTGATVVQFGGTNAFSFTVNSATQITATPAAGTNGVITVTTPGGTATSVGSFTIIPQPSLFTVGGTGSYCSTTGGDVTLTGSGTGVNYQLFREATALTTIAGTGSALNFGPQTTAGTYTIIATNTTSGCTATMTGSAVVTIYNPLAMPAIINGNASVCENSTGNSFSVTADPQATGYAWTYSGTGATIHSTGNSINIDFAAGATGGTLSVTASNSCGTSAPRTQNITINSSLPASVSIASNDADNIICAGTSVTFTATPINGGATPSYQWKVNGANTGTNSSTFTTSSLTNGQSVTVVLTSNAACATGSPATSNAIATTVNPSLPVSVSIAANPGTTICAGTSVTFTATPANGGTTPSYQWKLNGANVGTNSNTYTNSALVTGNIVTCELTSNATPCATGSPATSNQLTMTVNPALSASVSIASNDADNIICAGTSVTFTATPTNGGATPSYQWKLNGVTNVGTNSSTYTTTTLAANDKVTVVLTSNATCATGSPATSNELTMTVNPALAASVSIVSNDADNIICAGTSVTFTATPTNGGTTPSYQWKLNGVTNVGTNSPTYTTTTLATNDKITVVLTSNATCATGSPATSNELTMTVNPNLTVNVSVAANPGNTICGGTSVTFTATPTNGGTAPSYQWRLNGANVGTNSNTYTNNTLANGNTVICVLTSNATPCATGSPATSNTITMIVTSPPTTTGVTICQGSSGSLTSSAACAASGAPTSIGPKDPTTGASITGPGANWNNPTFVNTSDNNRTIADIPDGEISDYLKASNFGFAIPSGAIINGVTVTIERQEEYSGGNARVHDNEVLLESGATVSGNKATTTLWPSPNDGTATYGSTSDNWGVAWTPAQINDPTFGVKLSAINTSSGTNHEARVDNIRITVTYAIPGTLNWYTVSSGGSAIGNGSPFNPVGVSGSGLPNTNTPGTYTFYAECAAASGCRTATNFIINPAPTITGTLAICDGGTTQLTGSGSPAASNPWTSSNTSVATVNSTGLVTSQSPGTSIITYTNASNCPVTATVTINATPQGSLTSGGNICNGSSGTIKFTATSGSNPFTVIYSDGTSNFTVNNYNSGSNITVSPTTNTTYTLVSVSTSSCSRTTGFTTVSVSINVTPVITNNSVASAQTICSGSAPAGLTGSTPAGGSGTYTYAWQSSTTGATSGFGATIGTNQNYNPGTLTQTTWFRRTVSSGSCSDISTAIQITVISSIANNSVSAVQIICSNTAPAGLIGSSPTGGTGAYTYLWESSTTSGTAGFTMASGTSNSINYTPGVLTQTTWFRRTVYSGPCSNVSSAIQITITPAPTGNFTSTENSGPGSLNDGIICVGGSVTFTAPAGYPSYIFKVGTTTVQTGGSNTFSSSSLTNGALVTVDVANSQNCGTTFGPIVITVNPLPVVGLSASPSGAICPGTMVTFNATGGTNYTFKINNSTITSNTTGIFTSSTLNNGEMVTVDATDGNSCTGTSAAITMSVNSVPSGTLSSNPANGIICAGDAITFNATAAANTTYDFRANGVSLPGQTGANIFTTTSLTGSPVISVIATNTSGCSATFNAIPVTVNILPVVSVTTTENSGATLNDNNICAGGNVTFTATPGFSSYQFYLRGTGSPLASVGNAYSSTSLVEGDYVTVVATNNNGCSNAPVSSATIHVLASPSGSLGVSPNPVCQGQNVTLTASSDPTYNKYVFKANGTSILFTGGTGANTYTNNNFINGQSLTADVTNTNGCVTTFGPVIITVNTTPSGTITVSPNSTICKGESVTFTAPTGFTNYDWQLNGASLTLPSQNTYTTNTLSNNDKVSVAVTTGPGCIGLLNTITMVVNPRPANTPLTGPSEVCAGNNITLTFSPTGGSWSSSSANATVIGGVVTGVSAGPATISYTVSNSSGCDSIVTKDILVNALPVVADISPLNPKVCVGSTIQLTSTTSGGTWSSDNASATVDNSGLVTGVTGGGTATISYTVTNAKGCITVKSIVVTVNALPTVAPITFQAPATSFNVCVGNNITLLDATTGTSHSWSSSNTNVATVNNAGVVTGVSGTVNGGITTIRYTVTDGTCSNFIEQDVQVNTLPVPTLTGANPICSGSTETYTTEAGQNNYTWAITGGTVIGPSTNNTITVKWDQPGTRSIYVNYANTFGCTGATSATLTTSTGTVPVITPDPAPAVCLNTDGTYTTNAGMTNYVWTATGGTVTATGNTATVNWTTAGTGSVSVNFTDGNNCVAAVPTTISVLVNTLPTATLSSNSTSVCVGGAAPVITFTGANGKRPYTFTYSIEGVVQPVVSTNSTSNSVTVTAPTGIAGSFGYSLISVADDNTCSQGQSESVTVTVNPLPTTYNVTGGGSYCSGGTGIEIGLSGSQSGVNYQLYNGAATVGAAMSGSGAAISFGNQTAGGTYTVVATNTTTGCPSNMTGSVAVTVNPLPTLFTVTGGGNYCIGGSGVAIGLSNSQVGINYQLYNGPATVGSPLSGTGVAINFGNQTAVGTYTVVASNTNTGCASNMTGTVTVTINPLPTAFTVSGGGAYCSGGTGVAIGLSGSESGVNYQLYNGASTVGSPVGGTGSAISFGNQTAAGTTYTVIAVNTTTNCTNNMAGSVSVTINPLPSVFDVTGGGAYCNGGAGVAIGLSGSQSGVNYQLYNGVSVVGPPVSGTGSAITFGSQTAGGTYTVIAINTTTNCTNNMSGSVSVTVNPIPTVTITNPAAVCSPATVNLTDAAITAGSTASLTFTYWTDPSATISYATPTTTGAGSYYIKGESATGCYSVQLVTVTVNAPPPVPTVLPVTATVCQGSILPLTAGTAQTNSSVNLSNGTSYTIPDDNATGAASTIAVSGIPAGAIINSVSVTFNITHSNDADLRIHLKAPNNNVLNLVSREGGSGNNFNNTTISSNAGTSVVGQSAPFSGTYAPEAGTGYPGATTVPGNTSNATSFADLYSVPNGNWIFSARDDNNNGNGTINNWSIIINYTVNGTPETVIWSPQTDLYTDASATAQYTGQSLSTVYVKPSTSGNKVYTATATNAANCSSSANITLTVNTAPVVSIFADYCARAGYVRLTASSTPTGATYVWSTGQTGSSIDVDIADVYDVAATLGGCSVTASISVAQELVTNGDFNNGNNGFTSDYAYKQDVPGLVPANQGELWDDSGNNGYSITENGQNVHKNFWGQDHTGNKTGPRNFMAVNGHGDVIRVWKQTVNVLPNTTYYFSAWAMSLNNAGPFAQLQFSVNGTLTGTQAVLASHCENCTTGNANDNWVRFYGTWTSGPTTTTADIYINDLQPSRPGNDFGLDDISFGTLSTFITLESAPGTDAQTPCVNTPITPIVYSVGSTVSGPTISPALPPGLTSSFNGILYTISGTPTVAGPYTYTLTTTGSCLPSTATGTINTQAQTIKLSAGSVSPTVCVNTPVNIGFALSGAATGATILSGPAFLSGSGSPTYTVTGTPTIAGVYPYTVVTTGTGCTPDTVRGNITVQSQTITLNSGNDNQTVCINKPVSDIRYSVGGPEPRDASVSGLPPGVTGSYQSGFFIITGTPISPANGVYPYTVTATGACASVTASGTITVSPDVNISLSSAVGSDNQIVCTGNSLPVSLTYTVNNGTTASVTGLPAGLSGTFSGNTFTISGTITDVGKVYNYTITVSGNCAPATITGKITVQSQAIALSNGTASPSLCVNTLMPDIEFTIGGTATAATVTWLPSDLTGVSLQPAGINKYILTGTPSVSGPYTYTITTSGPGACSPASVSGTITVGPAAVAGTLTSLSVCSGVNRTLTLAGKGATDIVDHWESSPTGSAPWLTITNNTISLTYNNITSAMWYRVQVGNTCGLVYSNVALVGVHNLWTGLKSSDWSLDSNWSDIKIPDASCPNVHIPGGTPNQPVLSSGMATINNLLIDAGATLTVTGATMQIAGAITNTGIFDVSNGTLEFNGPTTQSIAGSMFKDHTLKNLIIGNTGAGLNVAGVSTDTLKITGGISFGNVSGKVLDAAPGGHLTLISNNAGTAWVADVTNNGANTGNNVTGNVTVERYINIGASAGQHGRSWQLVATPTKGQTVWQSWMENGITASTGYGTQITGPGGVLNGLDLVTPTPSLKYYDPASDNYIGIANSGVQVYNPIGYMLFVRGDRSIVYPGVGNTTLRTTGQLFTGTSAPISVPANKFGSAGNPYASAVDMRKITLSGGVDPIFILWDPQVGGVYGLGAFQYLQKTGSDYYATPGGGSYGSGINNYIQSGQAFFMQTTGSAGTIGFTENAKASGSKLLMRPMGTTNKVVQLRTNLYGINPDGSSFLTDGTLLQYSNDYTNVIDGMDARKVANTSENLSIKSGGKDLVIERRASITERDTIFYNLTGVRVQPYRFEFIANGLEEYGLKGWVEDTYLKTRTPLKMEGTTAIDFTIENIAASYAADRFRIVFKVATVAVPLPVTFVSVKATQKDDDIAVDWEVKNESNINHYEVEKSLDGSSFVKTATVVANNNGAGSYTWLDKNVTPGWNYYRIRSVENTGKKAYTGIAKVWIQRGAPAITIHPNPITNGVINLQLINQPAGMYGIRLLNPLGQVIVTKQISHAEGSSSEKINWDYHLAHGAYQLEVTKPDGRVKMITVMY